MSNENLIVAANDASLGLVVVSLMKGVIYRDQHPAVWLQLEEIQGAVLDYVRVMGLDLIIDEAEGYAFLRQLGEQDVDESAQQLPRLVARRPLSFPVSLLCVLLRKKMVELDATGGDARLILTREQIVEMMRVFLPDRANEARLFDQIDTHINKVAEFGFLKKLAGNPPAWEVRRIIKALVDADWLADFNEKLKVYRGHADTLV